MFLDNVAAFDFYLIKWFARTSNSAVSLEIFFVTSTFVTFHVVFLNK